MGCRNRLFRRKVAPIRRRTLRRIAIIYLATAPGRGSRRSLDIRGTISGKRGESGKKVVATMGPPLPAGCRAPAALPAVMRPSLIGEPLPGCPPAPRRAGPAMPGPLRPDRSLAPLSVHRLHRILHRLGPRPLDFPGNSRGVRVPPSPLWFSIYRAKLFYKNSLAFFLRCQKAPLVHNWCTNRAPGGLHMGVKRRRRPTRKRVGKVSYFFHHGSWWV